MCFSATGDLVGGAVVLGIGVDACAHLRGHREYRLVAALPFALGAHQVDESLVWLSLEHAVPRVVGTVALWAYLVFALVVLPAVVPWLVAMIEPRRDRRVVVYGFGVLGVAVAAVLLGALVAGSPSVHLATHHLAYSVGLPEGIVVVGAYVVATCGSLLASSSRPIQFFGVANAACVVVLAVLMANGFTSLWCAYAALVAGAIALQLRFLHRHDREREFGELPRGASA